MQPVALEFFSNFVIKILFVIVQYKLLQKSIRQHQWRNHWQSDWWFAWRKNCCHTIKSVSTWITAILNYGEENTKLSFRKALEESFRYVAKFMREMNTAINTYPPSRILNMDKKAWEFLSNQSMPYDRVGSTTENEYTDIEIKISFIAIGTVSMDGAKHQMWEIAKRLTNRAIQSQFSREHLHQLLMFFRPR